MKEGDFIVGGRNFGCGSSREHAPLIMKIRGVKAVLAKSFARIFYRNAINIGLPAIECDTDKINEGDELQLDMNNGLVLNKTTQEEITFKALSPLMQKILNEGGVVNYIRKYKDLPT
jgi:3-isopropylmalate/(R)-2-methylmalate dehydratase small subunit